MDKKILWEDDHFLWIVLSRKRERPTALPDNRNCLQNTSVTVYKEQNSLLIFFFSVSHPYYFQKKEVPLISMFGILYLRRVGV